MGSTSGSSYTNPGFGNSTGGSNDENPPSDYSYIGGGSGGGGGGSSAKSKDDDEYYRRMRNLRGINNLGVSNLNAAAVDSWDAIKAQSDRNDRIAKESLSQAYGQSADDWYKNRMRHQAAFKSSRDASGTALYSSLNQGMVDAHNKSLFSDEFDIIGNLKDQLNSVNNAWNVSRAETENQRDQWAQEYRNAYRQLEADTAADYANAYDPNADSEFWTYGDVFGDEGEYLGLPWEKAEPGSYWDYVFGEHQTFQPTQRFLRSAAGPERSMHREAGTTGSGNKGYWDFIRGASGYENRSRR